MSHLSALLPEERDWIDALIDAEVDNLPSVRAVNVAARVIADVRRLAELGDDRAQRVLEALATDGAYARVRVRIKDRDRSMMKVSRTGAIISVPTRIGHRLQKSTGPAERAHQQWLWFEMTWDQFEVAVRDRARILERESVSLEAFREVMSLRERYPDTRTPMEACERAGIDPRSFGLGRAA